MRDLGHKCSGTRKACYKQLWLSITGVGMRGNRVLMGNNQDIPNPAVWKGVEIALKVLGSFCPLWVLDRACVSKVSRHHVCCILGHVTSRPHTVSNFQKGGCRDAQIWGVLVASFEHVRAMAMIDASNLPVVHRFAHFKFTPGSVSGWFMNI